MGLMVLVQFGIACLTPNFSFPCGWIPRLMQGVTGPSKWHLNPLNHLSKVHKWDRQQTTPWRNV